MTILFFLLPLSLLMSSLGALAFAWGARSGQWDDLVKPGESILFDETSNRKD